MSEVSLDTQRTPSPPQVPEFYLGPHLTALFTRGWVGMVILCTPHPHPDLYLAWDAQLSTFQVGPGLGPWAERGCS